MAQTPGRVNSGSRFFERTLRSRQGRRGDHQTDGRFGLGELHSDVPLRLRQRAENGKAGERTELLQHVPETRQASLRDIENVTLLERVI
jgi:hypothetical protein